MNLNFGGSVPLSAVNWHGRAVCTVEEAAEGAARVAASRGTGAEERLIGGSRP